MTLGENIQAARKNKGLSQEALAEQVGVSRQALGKWEKDTALPSLDNLRALAAVLECRGWSESGDRYTAVWDGTFWSEESKDGWPYKGGTVDFVVRLTDASGNVWTNTHPLSEKT